MRERHNWKTRLLIVAAALLVIAALAGCRSRSEEAAEPAVDADATATAEAQLANMGGGEEAAAPTEAPAEVSPTQVSPTEEPPTAEPPAEPAGGGESLALGACNHPYYPIRDGALYRYRMSVPGMDDTEMTIEYRVTGPDSFVTTQTYADITSEAEWTCTEEGLVRTSLGLGGMDIPGVEYTVDGVSGVTFPPVDQLQVGKTWQSTFTMSGEMSAEGFAIKMNIEAVTDNVLAAFESVTTPAGDFDAAKIDTTTTINMDMDMGDMPAVPGMPGMSGMTTSTTMWLAEGVGMVKTESEDPTGGTSVMELVATE